MVTPLFPLLCDFLLTFFFELLFPYFQAFGIPAHLFFSYSCFNFFSSVSVHLRADSPGRRPLPAVQAVPAGGVDCRSRPSHSRLRSVARRDGRGQRLRPERPAAVHRRPQHDSCARPGNPTASRPREVQDGQVECRLNHPQQEAGNI